MKKIALIALISLSFFQAPMAKSNLIELSTQELPTLVLPTRELGIKDIGKLGRHQKLQLLDRFDKILNSMASNIDCLLTRNGLIKTLIVTFPFISLYAYLFPPEPVADLLGRILNYGIDSTADVGARVIERMLYKTDNFEAIVTAIGELEGKYNLSKQIGQEEAFWQMLYEKPLASLTLLFSSTADKLWNNGLPFISIILANKFFNVQR